MAVVSDLAGLDPDLAAARALAREANVVPVRMRLVGVWMPTSSPLRQTKPLRNWISVRRPLTMSWPIDGRCSPPPGSGSRPS